MLFGLFSSVTDITNNKNKYFEIVIKIIYKNITSASPVPNQGLAKF